MSAAGMHCQSRDAAEKAQRAIIVVFARLPIPGKVKTRLAAGIGADHAAAFYKLCAEHTALEVCRCHVADGMVFCAAAEDVDDVHAWLAAAGAAMPVHPQVQDADLGRRMIAALTAAATAPAQASAMTRQESAEGNPLDRGLQKAQRGQDPAATCSTEGANPMGQCYDAAIVIGTDIPDISSEVLAAAVQVLLAPSSSAQAADMVLGPAADGGYYLLGLRTRALLRGDVQDCSIFEGVQWSCSTVLQRTVAASTRLGLSVAPTDTLPTLQDIDTRQDAAVWVDQQQAEAGRMPQQEASAVTPQPQLRVQMQQLLVVWR